MRSASRSPSRVGKSVPARLTRVVCRPRWYKERTPGMSTPSLESEKPRRLSLAWVFLLVVSAASPITSLLGAVPLGFVQGNGAGLPAAYVVVTLVLVCFAVGYAAISRRVINTGAFYTYIAQGIGRPPAIGAGLLAVAAYTVNIAGIAGGGGYFLPILGETHGAHLNWVFGDLPVPGLGALRGHP